MRILILLLFCLNITYVKADEIYNLLKIPNLEIFKLKSKNNIRYLNTNNDFKIGVDDNITCKKTKKINLDKKFPVIEKNLSLYNSNFLTNQHYPPSLRQTAHPQKLDISQRFF